MARGRSLSLTDGEARLMAVLWQKQRATVADVVAALKGRRPVNYSTIQTMLRILEEVTSPTTRPAALSSTGRS